MSQTLGEKLRPGYLKAEYHVLAFTVSSRGSGVWDARINLTGTNTIEGNQGAGLA